MNNKKYLIIGIVAILIVSIGFSVAFWRANIEGEGSQMVVNFDKLKIVFVDSVEIIRTEEQNGRIRPGWNVSKTFTIKNEGSSIYFYNINLDNLINTFVTEGYLQYKITSTDGGYNMEEYSPIQKCEKACKQVLATNIAIDPEITQTYTIYFRYINDIEVDQSVDMNKEFSGKLSIDGSTTKTFTNYFAEKYPEATKRTDFSTTLSEGKVYYEDGLYTENSNRIYYWTGASTDNWVKFGKDGNSDIYWRIIRTNEDGGLRLLYAGTSPDTEQGYINPNDGDKGDGTYQYNDKYDNTAYVGYMYGSLGDLEKNRENTEDSPIKKIIDKWYSDKLLASYNQYISKTAIYCNDRSSDNYKENTGYMYFAAVQRTAVMTKNYGGITEDSKIRPSFTCGTTYSGGMHKDASDADKFTAKNNAKMGNQLLQYPVALMTADEVVYAGGKNQNDSPQTYYYLNSNNESIVGDKWWWTMSPAGFNDIGQAFVHRILGLDDTNRLGHLRGAVMNTFGVIRPVLSLKSCVTLTGTGSPTDPYIPHITDSCAKLDN